LKIFQGRSSSQSEAKEASGALSKSALRYFNGSMPLDFAVSINEYIPQELSAPWGLFENNRFDGYIQPEPNIKRNTARRYDSCCIADTRKVLHKKPGALTGGSGLLCFF
jgi:hypothetical protein